jgi:hypothetical protein
MLPPEYACPKCKCRACYALHRKGFDFVMSLFGLRPARCLTCSRRFYARYRLSEDGKYVNGGRSGRSRQSTQKPDEAGGSAPTDARRKSVPHRAA